MKTSELTGLALNWAVAQCESKIETGAYGSPKVYRRQLHLHYCGAILFGPYDPSTDWSQGGPIIEREKMTLSYDEDSQTYSACVSLFRQRGMSNRTRWRRGSTPLVAAMRCLVASKMGEEVEIPEELLK